MTWAIGDTLTDAEINGIISVFCHYYEHHEPFNYTDETIELETCNLQILNGIYTDEELIVETPLQINVSDEVFPNQNYLLGVNYYSYTPDVDDELLILNRGYYPLTIDDNGVAEINFDNNSIVYIMLDNWELITKFNKPTITEVT